MSLSWGRKSFAGSLASLLGVLTASSAVAEGLVAATGSEVEVVAEEPAIGIVVVLPGMSVKAVDSFVEGHNKAVRVGTAAAAVEAAADIARAMAAKVSESGTRAVAAAGEVVDMEPDLRIRAEAAAVPVDTVFRYRKRRMPGLDWGTLGVGMVHMVQGLVDDIVVPAIVDPESIDYSGAAAVG